jgi:hypothetical protein
LRSVAEPACPDGVVLNLNGAAVIFSGGREFSCAAVLAGVLFIVFGGEYPNRHFFSRGVMTQGGESMKQTKNSKALRDTFLVIRKGIRIHPSRKALLFQKMKNQKPKKGSKVLCISEGENDPKDPVILPPTIGWVYLVQEVRRLNDSFSEFDPKGKRIGVSLVGFGIPKKQPHLKIFYDASMFRVIGKAKMISPQ